MDWLRQAAAQLREWLMQQTWLDGWQLSIAHTPDWALLAAGPATLLLFALLLRITWPGSRTSAPDTRPKAPQAQKQSRQQAFPNVAPAPATTKSPPTPAPARKPAAVQLAASRAPTQMAGDDEDNRSVRVFVSSTFLDMQTERDELVTKAFPALRAKYRARGVEVFEVDLRWGITREQQERGETLPTLLSEIDRCRPYFIGLLGDRYGWVPPSEALTDKLKADYPILAGADGVSVTAIEIMHGVLSDPDAAARAVFFQRDPNWDWHATLNDADRATAAAEPEATRAKLEDLKARIRQKAGVETYARPEEIGAKVTAALDALLEARFPEAGAPDAFEQTARLHRAYARERRQLHVGADGYMHDLNRWMETKDSAPLLITGPSGGGKSTLVANWLQTWRKAHPIDIVFEHYLGASPDSADPMLIMQRLWEQLNRATGETVAPPGDNAELMDVAAALAQRLAQARASAERSGTRVLIALDGLDKLSSEQNLRWLPIVPRVHWLASSLAGATETAARARGFAPLDIKPLSEQERRDFIAGTLKRWRRELEPQHIARILQPAAAELAGSPLYLKTVLEELRVSADNARLAERLEDYRAARDMANLFDRVLKRLEDDCEPGLVAKALPLIWASRAGLEEAEILTISGASPLAWATVRNGLGDGLRDQQGRIAFSHDYLSLAVATRYLKTDEQKRLVHLALADRFEAREPDERQAEELPYQIRAAESWERLEALLVDLDRFKLLRARGDAELLSHWLPLKQRGRDPESLLCAAFEARAPESERWTLRDAHVALALTRFLDFSGAFGPARVALQEQLLSASERLFGRDHAFAATALNNLALLYQTMNRQEEGESLYRRALAIDEANFGSDHPKVAMRLNNLAELLRAANRLEEAEPLYRRALAIDVAQFGDSHPDVARDVNGLALLLEEHNRLSEAEVLFRRALAINESHLAPNDPILAKAMNNLAALLQKMGRHDEAQSLLSRALTIDEANFGAGHANVANRLNNLALSMQHAGRHEEAEAMLRRALAIDEESHGPNHPAVATTLDNLAGVLSETDRKTEAEDLYRRALAIAEAAYAPDHPRVTTTLNNLALLLKSERRYREAEPLYRRAIQGWERGVGKNHADLASSLFNLGQLLQADRGFAEGEPLLRRALDIGEDNQGVDVLKQVTRLNDFAYMLADEKRYVEADEFYQRALATLDQGSLSNHPEAAMVLNNLALLREATGDFEEALTLYKRSVDTNEGSLGPNHPKVAIGLKNWAKLLQDLNRHAEAEPLYRRSLAIDEQHLGPEHPSLAWTISNLAALLYADRRFDETEALLKRELAIQERTLGDDHPELAPSLNNLAHVVWSLGRPSEALPLFKRAHTMLIYHLGAEHPNTRRLGKSVVECAAEK